MAILDGEALGAVEIVRHKPIYDFRSKTHSGALGPASPGTSSPERYRSVLRLAVMAHEALGCDGATRVDLIVSDRGNEIILEANTLPDLSPTSLWPDRRGRRTFVSRSGGGDPPAARLRAHGHRRERRGFRLGFEGPERRAGITAAAH